MRVLFYTATALAALIADRQTSAIALPKLMQDEVFDSPGIALV